MTKLTMRPLTGQDTFKILSILHQLEVGDMFKGLVGKGDNSVSDVQAMAQKRGMTIVSQLIDSLTKNLPKIQNELNEFLADLCGVDTDTIKELSFKDYNTLILDFFKKEELQDFFQQLSSSKSKA